MFQAVIGNISTPGKRWCLIGRAFGEVVELAWSSARVRLSTSVIR